MLASQLASSPTPALPCTRPCPLDCFAALSGPFEAGLPQIRFHRSAPWARASWLSSQGKPFPNQGLLLALSDVLFASLVLGSFCRSLATLSSALLLAGQALQVDSAGVLLIAALARAELSPIPGGRALVCTAENLPVSLVKPALCFCWCCRLRSARRGYFASRDSGLGALARTPTEELQEL